MTASIQTQIPDYNTLTTDILRYVDRNDKKTVDFVPLAINNSEKWIMRELRMPSMEKMVEFQFEGQGLTEGWFTMPQDLLELKSFWFFDAYGDMTELCRGTMQQIALHDGRSFDSGAPHIFARSSNRMYVRPKPDASTTFQMVYYRDLTEMSATRSSYLYEIAHDVLLFAGVAEVYRFLFDTEKAEYFQGKAGERLVQIQQQVKNAEMSGGVMTVSMG